VVVSAALGSSAPGKAVDVAGLPTWSLTPPQRDDVELLQTRGYAPLAGFPSREPAAAPTLRGRRPAGRLPAPDALAVSGPTAEAARTAGRLALTDDDGTLLAVLEVVDHWVGVDGVHRLAGPVRALRRPTRWDLPDLRATPHDLRGELASSGPVLVVQPAGAADERSAVRWSRAATELGARLLLYPAVGPDPDRRELARVRALRALLPTLPPDTLLRLLPSGRDASDPRAAMLHALVARNAGATHLVPSDAPLDVDTVRAVGLRPVDPTRYGHPSDPPPGRLDRRVAAALRQGDPPRSARGVVVLLSGLSGSGKSTIAKALRAELCEVGDREITLLDGDLVRQHLSSELGFSREHRDLNVRRIGFVASEIARHGGIAICAPIAPYDDTRRAIRALVERAGGGFVLVHVATPLEVCESRDVKGLYARARTGELTGFTGIDDPYQPPGDAEVTIDTSAGTAVDAAAAIVHHLVTEGWLTPP
jgi:sulfate adenylyltransferase